jgi:hypothetical protein
MGEEARALCVDVPIAVRRLLMSEEALWHNEMKIILGTRHCHIE